MSIIILQIDVINNIFITFGNIYIVICATCIVYLLPFCEYMLLLYLPGASVFEYV